MKDRKELSPEDRSLGMGRAITRRDFLNNSLIGVGGALLAGAAPGGLMACSRPRSFRIDKDPWWGYGAVGDYASSPGNPRSVMEAAHRIRDGFYDDSSVPVTETGEVYDLVVVGGGMSGLGAAHFFKKNATADQRCLLLENHSIFGGEAKRNEFIVDGQRLIGPQGSNDFGVPQRGTGSLSDRLFEELQIPREFEFQEWQGSGPPLRFGLDNYAHMTGIAESKVDIGYFFETPGESGRWVRNIWREDLRNAPFPEGVKRDLLAWRYSQGETSEEFRRRLDQMTYKEYIEDVLGLSPEVVRYIEPMIGLINGASPDAVSAFASSQIGMPGVSPGRGRDASRPLSFPGGNSAFARYFVKDLIPSSIEGGHTFEDILNRPVRFEALDAADNPIRMRLGATVVRVEHEGVPGRGSHVRVTYEKDGTAYTVRTRGVVMASGGWANQHVIKDLPEDILEAYTHFHHSPALIANVALTNWRFMSRLGITAARWFGDGFGFSCNIRQPMMVGDYRPPLDPDQPTILTFYAGVYQPGLSVYDQGVQGRWKLFSTSFADYERQIRQQMVRQFGPTGFDPENDIAGIILNRWGHARLVQQPGFFYGTDGHPAPREVVENGFGRIAIGHSELNGHQNWSGGVQQGYRAAAQIFEQL